jgi:LPS export ABC transporter protein LptC
VKRLLLAISGIAIVIGAAYLAGFRAPLGKSPRQQAPSDAPTYDYEANDVVVRQMGPDGSLQYQIDAKRVAQLAENGQIAASGLTLHFDPPDAKHDLARRWIVTAARAELPASGNVVTLLGDVLVRGRPAGASQEAQFRTERLNYDLGTQDVSSDAEVEMTWGRNKLRGQQLKANIKQGTVAIESKVHGLLAH